MTTYSAEAKLYTGIRSWCVDKNISAAITSSVTFYCLPQRLKRTYIDLEATASIALTNERYKTYGGGNNVITPGDPRVIDNTDNAKIISSLVCKFPTYLRIDVEKLQLPEGTDCVVSFEEGWILEGDFPGSTRQPSPEVKDFFTFRTPWYGLSFMNVSSSLNYSIQRRRTFNASASSYFTPNFAAIAEKVGYIELYSTANILAGPTYNASAAADLYAVSGGYPTFGQWEKIALGTRIYQLDSTMSSSTTLTLPESLIILFADAVLQSDTSLETDFIKYKGSGFTAVSSNTSIDITANKQVKGLSSSSLVTSLSSAPVKNISMASEINVSSSLSCDANGAMTLVYNTNLIAGNTISLPLNGTVNATIDWGDGSSDTITTAGFHSHTYASKGTYTVKILGEVTHYGSETTTAATGISALTTVYSFGQIGITSLKWAFISATNLTIVPDQLPSSVTTLYGTFYGCSSFNGSIPNGNSFGSWNTSNINDLTSTFLNCTSFNRSINTWDTSLVTSMASTFQGCTSFNQSVSSWDTHNVTTMGAMFSGCTSFNQPLTRSGNTWDTFYVENTASMFLNCTSFNQDLSTWRMNSNRTLSSMFSGATSFNQSLGAWPLYSGGYSVTMSGMLNNCGMNTANYSATLNGWYNTVRYVNGGFPGFVALGATGRTYNSSATTARAWLVNYVDHPNGGRWTITGDSLV